LGLLLGGHRNSKTQEDDQLEVYMNIAKTHLLTKMKINGHSFLAALPFGIAGPYITLVEFYGPDLMKLLDSLF